ncbi:sushi, nidogen and EGF-like domain-containing protein 1, partial [Saccostrea cucullata]|uniref:sushi, nidogen and EGF-like domain-containing protein 1 n=1 Tax=Saccostrea cuccullata TaxID=36930 RepID=UPI002ED56304
MSTTYWRCTSGCTPAVNLHNVNNICTGASVSGNWEQGERTFTYTFPGPGPFKVEFTGGAWVTLSNRAGGSWSIGTIVNLKQRSDTHKPNTSPITTGKPMYIVQYNCQSDIRIPVADADGDDIRCRWSTGTECASICNALPAATIDSRTCTIKFPSNHTQNGIFAVAVTMEDFPKSTISIGSTAYGTNTRISSVTLQFLIKTPPLSGRCNDKPVFVSPTPAAGTTLQTNILQTFHVSFYASDSRRITKMDITSPAGMTYTSLQSVSSRPGTYFVSTSWIPQQNQVGSHIVCALAEDTFGKTSESRCLNIKVHDVSPCVSSPCTNGGTCIRQRITQNYRCYCLPGYTGHRYECASGPCQNSGTCHDHVNDFTCTCRGGFTGLMCQTDIDECLSDPCQNNGSCTDLINRFQCSCIPGFTNTVCHT